MGIFFCMTMPKQRAPTCAKKEQLQGTPLLPPTAESALCHNHFQALTQTLSSGAKITCQMKCSASNCHLHPPPSESTTGGMCSSQSPFQSTRDRLGTATLVELGVNLCSVPGAEVVSHTSLHGLYWTISCERSTKHCFGYLLIPQLKADCTSNISMNWLNAVNQLLCLEKRSKLILSGVLLFNIRFHIKAGTPTSVQASTSPVVHSDSSHKNLRIFTKTLFILLKKKHNI